MKKLLITLAASMSLLVSAAPPAVALEHGTVCKGFPGPDGAGGANVRLCLMVNEHDFQWKIQPMLKIFNNGTKKVEVHGSYLKLVKNGVAHITSNPFIETVLAGNNLVVTTNLWKEQPRGGPWHTRGRLWVCWPSFAGDPCGSVVVWNSGGVTFP